MTARFAFTVQATDGRARLGTIAMQRGEIRTPAFMPVGTAATVKAVKPEGVRAAGADIILGNTYHLMLRPGAERVARLGALHEFMGWDRPILTDSGGYQVMSLSELTKVTEKVQATVKELPTQVKEYRSEVEARVAKLTEQANDFYAQLAVRGERLVTQIRKQPSTEAAIAEGKEAVRKAEAAATAAKKSAKAGEKAVEDAAGKIG